MCIEAGFIFQLNYAKNLCNIVAVVSAFLFKVNFRYDNIRTVA